MTRDKAVKAAVAGIVGTIAFDLFGFIVMRQWDMPALLGEKIGGGLVAGILAHYANGIVLAILFVAVAPLFAGALWIRAIQFFTLQTIFGVWLFMLPLMGAGALGLGMGMGLMLPVSVLVRHWVFAVVVAFAYQRQARS
jgi:uncharacterized membrane protein YagU involved in acid resistance